MTEETKELFGIDDEVNAKLIKKAEELGWTVTETNDGSYTFQQYSLAGQDFSFSLSFEKEPEEIVQDLNEFYENFDPSHEAYIWLDGDGHGKNGAPYDMKDLYEDMEVCEKMLRELYDALIEVV